MTNDEFVRKRFVRRLKEMGILDEVISLIKPRGIVVEDLVGRGRTKTVVLARSEIMYWIRKKMKWSFPEIGKLFDRHHKIVLLACRKMELENPAFGETGGIQDPYDASEWIVR